MKPKTGRMPPVMILCGGKGTRLGDMTKVMPKPMIRIGSEPILRHIMNGYAAAGCTRFVLCLGYLQEEIVAYFRANPPERLGWTVDLVDTGAETLTGGRVWRAAKRLSPNDGEFFLTYGDGVSDIDHLRVLRKHLAAKRAITISGVHPASRYGELVFRGDKVLDFAEKSYSKFYVNGGFMVLSRRFLEKYLTSSATVMLERKPMCDAVASGDMTIYKHEGFWQCMDTPREYELLNAMWRTGKAPWKA